MVVVAVGLTISLSTANAASSPAPVDEIMPGCKVWLGAAEGQPTPPGYNYATAYETGRCRGLVKGIASFTPTINVCVPPAIEIVQMVRVIVYFIETHPEKRHEGFMPLAAQALLGAWRCKAGENPLGRR
jgi:hypothetical protein